MKKHLLPLLLALLCTAPLFVSCAADTPESASTEGISETEEMPTAQETDDTTAADTSLTEDIRTEEPFTEEVTEAETVTEEVTEAETVTEAPPELPSWDEASEEVRRQLDLLMSTPNAYDAVDYIAAHPEAYNTILALGDAALPYLQKVITETSPLFTNRIHMAQTAAYAIDPVPYDIVTQSPDGAYRLTLKVQSFFSSHIAEIGTEYGGMLLTDTASGAELFRKQANEVLCYPEIAWSSDGRFAVITHGHLKYGGGTPVVVDAVGCTVSSVDGIVEAAAAALGLEKIMLYSLHTEAKPSDRAGMVCIAFYITTHAASNPGFITGYCYVNGTTGEITGTVIEKYEPPKALS